MSAAEPVRVGVVGVGALGRHHARIYAEMSGAELVGVVDLDAQRAGEIAAAHGCTTFPDPASLVGRVQAVSVAVPTEHHRAIAGPLLEAGIDVLVEKPLAPDVDEAAAIVAAAEHHGRIVMVGHSERFNPAVIALMREVREPRFFEIHRLAAFTARSTDIDVVFDLMVHDLDLVLHLDGSDPVSIDAVGVSALTDKVDLANARVRLASGCVANLTASRISAEPTRRVRVFQATTYLSCDTARRRVERYRLKRTASGSRPEIEHASLPVEDAEPLGLELRAFVDAVRRREAPPVDGRHGLRVIRMAERVRAAIDAG